MQVQHFDLSPPSLDELAEKLKGPLSTNYEHATVNVVQCPDLRQPPFGLAAAGLSGNEKIADVGGQPNLFPTPQLGTIWNLTDIAKAMEMDSHRGAIIGAGAGPFHQIGRNCELVPNFSWDGNAETVNNQTRVVQIVGSSDAVSVVKSHSLDCALMVNLYGSSGAAGPVLKVTARKRKGSEKSFTECIRKALAAAYGETQPISLGGAFIIKRGRTNHHVMPDFPAEKDLPFQDRKQVNDWLTYHDFDCPIVGLSVLHSADPEQKMGLRMEHTHSFAPLGENAGGHYHGDVDGFEEEIEYEGYFNTAKIIYRVDKPALI